MNLIINDSIFMQNLSLFLSQLLIFPIKLYRLLISPWLGNCCRFYPSCSVYSIEAIKIHGPIKGLFMCIYRILRCNPFSRGGIDNVYNKSKE